VAERWHPGIGDPTFIGWLTVVGYLVATWLCARAARKALGASQELSQRAPRDAYNERSLFLLWSLSTLAMLGLGINKQLDLQSLFTQVLKDLSQRQGWYEDRRPYQEAFVFAFAGVGLVCAAGLAYLLRNVLRRAWDTLWGLATLMAFVVVRAASFNHVGGRFKRAHFVIELAGIVIVAVATHRAAKRYQMD
jgi:hypothetical protein